MGDRNQKYRDIKKVFIVRSEEDHSVYVVPIYVVLQLRESTIPNFIYRTILRNNKNWITPTFIIINIITGPQKTDLSEV